MHDRADRGSNRQAAGIRNGVVDMDKFNRKAAALYDIARFDLLQGRLHRQIEFFEFVFDDTQSQRRPVNGRIDRA